LSSLFVECNKGSLLVEATDKDKFKFERAGAEFEFNSIEKQ
jgi:hypothetical protein